MLAVSSEPFDSDEYFFEVKWDGFRCLSLLNKEGTILKSRNNTNFSFKFPELCKINDSATKKPVILDGEIVIMDGGVPSFYELQKRGWTSEVKAISRAAQSNPATYVVFDILFYDKVALYNLPLQQRKEILKESITPNESIYISEGITGHGLAFYEACVQKNLEGIVAKKIDSIYIPGKRSVHWKKIKKSLEGDFIICGFKQSEKGSQRVDGLILGCFHENKLAYQGTVGVGLAGMTGKMLFAKLFHHQLPNPLFKVPKEVNRNIQWVEPVFCCSVQFLEPAKDGGMRHPVFRGLREDLRPNDCKGIFEALAKLKGTEEEC